MDVRTVERVEKLALNLYLGTQIEERWCITREHKLTHPHTHTHTHTLIVSEICLFIRCINND